MVYPPWREMSISGKVMSRRVSGSTKMKNTTVATAAEKNDGHRIAPRRCASGLGGGSDARPDATRMSWLSLISVAVGFVQAEHVGGHQSRACLAQQVSLSRHDAVASMTNGVADGIDAAAVGEYTGG